MIKTEHVRMLDQLLNAKGELTDWEVGFMESVDKKRQYALSEKQVKVLQKAWDKVFGPVKK